MNTTEALLTRLVAFPTITADLSANHEALAYVAQYFTERGLSVVMYTVDGHESLVATPRPGEKRPCIMLYAHMDVVPATGDTQWQLQKRDGRYYGRGVFDMKYALAAYMVLVDELRSELDHYDIGIMVVTDEETGGVHGAKNLADLGYQPQICIMPDGGEGWGIEAYAKGYMRLRLETFGVSAHGSRPWEGDNALVKLITLIHELEALFPDNTNPEANTLNIGYIRGGHALNQIPDHAEAGLDVRFISAEAEVLLSAAITATAERNSARLTYVARGPAVYTDVEHPFVRTFTQLVHEVTGRTPEPYKAYGASDAAYFSEKGTICIIASPDAGSRHGPIEWVDADGVEHFKTILKRYIQAIAKQ